MIDELGAVCMAAAGVCCIAKQINQRFLEDASSPASGVRIMITELVPGCQLALAIGYRRLQLREIAGCTQRKQVLRKTTRHVFGMEWMEGRDG